MLQKLVLCFILCMNIGKTGAKILVKLVCLTQNVAGKGVNRNFWFEVRLATQGKVLFYRYSYTKSAVETEEKLEKQSNPNVLKYSSKPSLSVEKNKYFYPPF